MGMFGYKYKWGWVETGGVSLVYFLKGEAKWGSLQLLLTPLTVSLVYF